MISDPAHVATAKELRRKFRERRETQQRAQRQHAEGHTVMLRALPDYDALFSVDFTAPTRTPNRELRPIPTSEATPS